MRLREPWGGATEKFNVTREFFVVLTASAWSPIDAPLACLAGFSGWEVLGGAILGPIPGMRAGIGCKIMRKWIFGCEDRVAIFAGEDRELLADRGRSRNWYY